MALPRQRLTLRLVLVLLAGCLAMTLVAPRADAAPARHEHIHNLGHGYVLPQFDLVVSWSQNPDLDGAGWAEGYAYTGPGGHRYAMYSRGNGTCLDVKQGAATAGAELTTAPCQYARNSQWWALVNGTLTPWHAASAGLVATFHYPPNPWAPNRLVLKPREGMYGNLEQRFSVETHVIPH